MFGTVSALLRRGLFCMVFVGCQTTCHAEHQVLHYDVAIGLSDGQLKGLQYYARGFDLVRLVSSTDERNVASTLVKKLGGVYEIIEIKKGTPGVATSVSENRDSIWVSFEPGCAIQFRMHEGAYYAYGAQDCSFRYYTFGHDYVKKYLGPRSPWDPRALGGPRESPEFLLLMDMKQINRATKNKRAVPGRRVGAQ